MPLMLMPVSGRLKLCVRGQQVGVDGKVWKVSCPPPVPLCASQDSNLPRGPHNGFLPGSQVTKGHQQ